MGQSDLYLSQETIFLAQENMDILTFETFSQLMPLYRVS